MTNRLIELPSAFVDVLADSDFVGPVHSVLGKACSLVGDPTRSPQLFPEYTDHGTPHIQRVLNSAAFLISDGSRSSFTPTDVVVLVSAIVLHDSAMHLTRDGFLKLVNSPSGSPLIPDLDRVSWSVAWKQYYHEATHWDESHLRRIFGNEDHAPTATDLAELVLSFIHKFPHTSEFTA